MVLKKLIEYFKHAHVLNRRNSLKNAFLFMFNHTAFCKSGFKFKYRNKKLFHKSPLLLNLRPFFVKKRKKNYFKKIVQGETLNNFNALQCIISANYEIV